MTKIEPVPQSASVAEVGAFMADFGKSVGPRANVYASIKDNGTCHFTLYPNGITNDGRISSEDADSWSEASASLIKNWEAQRANHRSVKLREMALEIIQITADQGQCTDRALRLSFGQSEIDALGAEAAELATEMASNGPFSIVVTEHANAA